MYNSEKSKGIFEHKRGAEALGETVEGYRRLVDNIELGINVMDTGHNILMVNANPRRVYGVNSREIIGEKCYRLFEKRDTVCPHCPGIRAMATAQRAEVESEGVKDDGSRFNVMIHAFPTFDQDGTVTGFIEVVEDITERKRTEQALRESEERYRTLIDSSLTGVFIEQDERFVFVNDKFAEMHGYKPEELLGRDRCVLLHPDEREMAKQRASGRLRGEAVPKYYEIQRLRKDGKLVWHDIMVSDPIIYQGKPAIMGHEIDISQRKKMEKERAGLIRKLQKRNKELLKSNQQIKEITLQLVQSEKMSALGELTAGVAHELNQPLNGIKIISQSLLRDIDRDRFEQDKLVEELTEIVNQVNKMAEIIDHMRIFTRKSEGMPKEMIDLNTVIEGPFKLLNQQLKSHNIEVVTELAPALPRVTGDPIRLEQVFMNLITNARNAMDSVGKENKRIEIRSYEVDDRKEVAAEVKDNGGGIPEDLKDKIFQPFFTTTDPGKGTGLGLSVSSKIVEEHRGRIELESEEGKGSTFRVILPIAG